MRTRDIEGVLPSLLAAHMVGASAASRAHIGAWTDERVEAFARLFAELFEADPVEREATMDFARTALLELRTLARSETAAPGED